MPPESPSQKLSLSEFSSARPEEWRAAAEKLLKGVPFEKKMISRTYEGIDLQPIYTAEPAGAPAIDRELPGNPPFPVGDAVDRHHGALLLCQSCACQGACRQYQPGHRRVLFSQDTRAHVSRDDS